MGMESYTLCDFREQLKSDDGDWNVRRVTHRSSIRPSTHSTMIAARLLPASHIVHNNQSLFPGPDKSPETHDPHPSKHLIVLHSQTTLA